MVSTLQQIVLLIVVLSLAFSCNNTRIKQAEKRNIPVVFLPGDVAFRRGEGVASRAVLASNKRGSFSHVGVIMQVDSQWMVVHEVPYEGESRDVDKIYSEPVEEFFNTAKAASGAVYRLQGIDSTQRSVVCAYLQRQLERDIPFDHDYDLSDSTRQYCSELVWRSYLEIGVDLSQQRRTHVTMPIFSGVHIMPADIELNDSLLMLYRF